MPSRDGYHDPRDLGNPLAVEKVAKELKGEEMTCPPLLRELGERVSQVIDTDKACVLLNEYGADSWVDGACHILMTALLRWLGDVGSPVWLISERGHEHMLVKIKDCYLDGMGTSTQEELFERWKAAYGIKELRLEPAESIKGLACPYKPVFQLVGILRGLVGPGGEIAKAIRKII